MASTTSILGQQVKALYPGSYDHIDDETLGAKIQANPVSMVKFQEAKRSQEAARTAEENKPGIVGKALGEVGAISQYPSVIADYALTGGKNIVLDENAPFLSGGIRVNKSAGKHARELVERGAAAAATGDIGQLNTYSDEPYAGSEEHVRKGVAKASPIMAGTEAVLGKVGEKAVDLALDPNLWLLGGAGRLASTGGQAAGLLRSGAAATPEAAAALAKLASQGKMAGAVATGAGAAFVPGMVEGAIHESGDAATKFAEGDTVAGLESGTSAAIDALFAVLGAKHTVGAVRGGIASGQKPVATEGTPDPALTGPRHFTVDAPAGTVDTIKGQAAKAAAELVGGGAGAMAASAIGLPSFVGRAPGSHLLSGLAARLSGKAQRTVPLQAGVPKELKGVPEMEIDAGLSPFDELIRTQRAEQAGTVQAPGMSNAGEFGRPFNEFEMTEAVSNVDRMLGEQQENARAAQAAEEGAPLDPVAQAQAELKQLAIQNRLKAEKLKAAELTKKEAEAQRLAELEAEHPDLPGLVEKLSPPNGPLPYAKAVEQARAALGLPPKAAAPTGPTTPGALSPEEAAAGVAANDPFQTAENVPAGEVGARLAQAQPKPSFQMSPEEQAQLIGMLSPELQQQAAPTAPTTGAPERLAGEIAAADPFQKAANVPAGEVVPTMKEAGVPEPEVSKGEARAKELGIERNEIDNHPEYDRTVEEWKAGTLTTRKKVDGTVQDVPLPQTEQGAKQMRAIARSRAVEAITAERETAAKGQTASAPQEQQFAQFKEQAMAVIEQLKGNEGAVRAYAVKLGYPKEVIDRMLPELLAEYKSKQLSPLDAVEGRFAGVRKGQEGAAPDLLEQMKAEAAKTVPPPTETPIDAAKKQAGVETDLERAAREAAESVTEEPTAPTPELVNNASAESGSGGSAEALSRTKAMSAKGQKFVRVDKAGNATSSNEDGGINLPKGQNYGILSDDGTFQALERNGGSETVKKAQKAPAAAPAPATAPKKAVKPAEEAKAQETATAATGDVRAQLRALMSKNDKKAAGDLARKSNPGNKMKITLGGKQYGVGDIEPVSGRLILDVEEGGLTLLRMEPRKSGEWGTTGGSKYSAEEGQRGGAASSGTPKGRSQYSAKRKTQAELDEARDSARINESDTAAERGFRGEELLSAADRGFEENAGYYADTYGFTADEILTGKLGATPADRIKLYGLTFEEQRAAEQPKKGKRGRAQYSVEGDFVAVPRKPTAPAMTELERLKNESEGRGGLTPPDADTVRPFADDWMSIEDLKRHQPIPKGEKQYSAEPDKLGFYSHAEKVVSDPKAPKKQHGKAWDSYLRSPQRGVTKDEMYWTGLEDFLRENADKPVTSERIAQYLKANKVEIVERGTTKDVPKVYVDVWSSSRTGTPSQATVYADRASGIPLEINVRKSVEETGGWLFDHPVSGDQYHFETKAEAIAEAKQVAENRLKEMAKSNTYGTRHASYQEPGEGGARPTNYREIRISVPKTREGENTFEQGAHYKNEPGIVTTFRVNSRKDVNGKKVLFVEEIQSDAGSAAKHGTKGNFSEIRHRAEVAESVKSGYSEELQRKYFKPDGPHWRSLLTAEEFDKLNDLTARAQDADAAFAQVHDALDRGAPENAPFITSTQKYTDLATKRLLRIAAEEGYDRVAWTRGDMQNRRWSITQVADQLYYDGNTLTGFKGGENVFAENVRPEELPNYIGKGATSRLLSSKGEKLAPYTIHERAGGGFVLEGEGLPDLRKRYNTRGEAQAALDLMAEKQPTLHRLEGADLEVGEQWANDYYDRIVPSSFEKVGKRFGAKVDKTSIEFERPHEVIGNPRDGFWVADGIGNPIKWEDFESESGARVGRPAGRKAETDRQRPDRDYFEREEDAEAFAKQLDDAAGTTPDRNVVQSIEITPEMREGIVKEGFPQYKGEPKAQGEWKPPTMAEVKKNLPKGLAEKLVKLDDGSYEIETPRGVIRIVAEEKIQVDLEALERGREGAAAAYERGEISISGEKATFGGEAIVRAVRAGVLPHEVGGHVWLDHFASPQQRQFLREKFEAEAERLKKDWREVMADAYSEYHQRKLENPGWEPTSQVGKFVQSIYTFMHGLYNNFRPSVEGTFEQIRSGKEFGKAPVRGVDTGLVPQYAAGPRGPRTATADAISRIRDTKQARPGVKGLLETQKVDLAPRIAKPKEKGQYNVEMREKVKRGEKIPIVGTGKDGKILVEDVAQYLHKDTLKRLGVVTGEDPKAVLQRALDHAEREVGYQLDTGRSGHEWYKADIEKLDNDLRRVFPELQEKSPEKTMFKTIVALLSPNTRPDDNLMRASRLWDAWKDTGFDPAAIPIKRPAYLLKKGQAGQWGRGSESAMTKMQRLLTQEGSIEAAVKWLETEHSVRALRDAGWGDIEHRKMDDVATGFEAFGPKVGQFVQNLEGNAQKLTVDKWFMRTWGRYMGTLVDKNGLLRETPLESQRPIMEELAKRVGDKYKMDPADVQATLWYYEQQLYQDLGAKLKEASYGESAQEVARRIEEARVQRSGPKGKGGTPEGGGPSTQGSRPRRVPKGGAAEGSLEKKVSGGIARLDQFESVEAWHEHHRNLGFSETELREALKQRSEGEEPASLQKLVGVGDVMIHTPSGREPVKGYDSGTPGLSITHDKGGKGKGLVLTHNGTGLSLGIVVPNTAGAQARLRQFAADFAGVIGEEGMKDPTKLDRATARKVGQMADEFRSKNEPQRGFARAYGKLTPAAKKMAEALDDRVEATTIKSAEQIRALAKKDPVGYALDAATNHLLDNMQRVAHKTDIGREFSAESDPAEIYKGGFVNRQEKSRNWVGLRKPVWMANRAGEFGAGEVYVQRGNALVDSIDKRFGIRYDNLKTEMAKIARGDASAIDAAMETYVYSLQHTLAHEVLHGFRGTVDVPGLFKVAGKLFGRDALIPKHVTRNEGSQMQARMNLSATELLDTKLPDGTTIRDGLKQYFDSPKMREHLRSEMQAQARRALKDRGIKYDISPDGLAQAMSFREKMAKEEALGKASGKTAMSRTKASTPARQYVDHVKGKTVFDWGAGQGADIKFFKESGATEVKGYDPNHMPDKPEGMADVVTSTYVGNVLPPVPRRQMFVEAFSRAKDKLLVAVRSDKISGEPHEDGVITSTGTFQKSYKPGELIAELKSFMPSAVITEGPKIQGASTAIVSRKKLPTVRGVRGYVSGWGAGQRRREVVPTTTLDTMRAEAEKSLAAKEKK